MPKTAKTTAQLTAEIERLRKEREELEMRVDCLATDLERAKKELELFAYVVSHDLREPLRMVSSYMQLLERKYAASLDDLAKEFIYYAVDGASRMNDMIDGLLVYSRVGTRGGEFAPVDCESVIEEVLAGMGKTIAEADAEIVKGPLPTVSADRKQLIMLFENLIDNAIKFVKKDVSTNVRISAEFVREENLWLFSVRDNGIGIDPKDAERIFIVFQRLHARSEYSGFGMGLPVCKKIVERHGGNIRVESEPGVGSTFYFTIPNEADDR